MSDLIACCGLNCEECDARQATLSNDNSLRERTARKWSEMNHAPEITAATIECMGCRTAGVKFEYCSLYCLIRKCVTQKGFQTCAECPHWKECRTVGAIIENNPRAKANLSAFTR